jgi:hypothetical protein
LIELPLVISELFFLVLLAQHLAELIALPNWLREPSANATLLTYLVLATGFYGKPIS